MKIINNNASPALFLSGYFHPEYWQLDLARSIHMTKNVTKFFTIFQIQQQAKNTTGDLNAKHREWN